MLEDKFKEFADKMQAEGLPDVAIQNFKHHYKQLFEGSTGYLPESTITPVDTLTDTKKLTKQHHNIGKEELANTVLLKLNGGLGTSMGMAQAKSLIRVKQAYSFLDIIARHAIHSDVKLVLMNSDATRSDSDAALTKYDELKNSKLPIDFIQHKVPKINQDDLRPASFSDNSEHEWCPPGHGDIYIALVSSGMLDSLLDAGYRYAFISNADNLGATIHAGLLGYLVEQKLSFLMEVVARTEMDKKGGHLAYGKDQNLILREAAQCPEEDRNEFENISKHRYFNTNNLWINLPALRNVLEEKGNIPDLPLITNRKTVDPKDSASTPIYQLETAMGAAISIFPNAQAIQVPRSRFAPVKITNELLLVQSDFYELSESNDTLKRKAHQTTIPLINLDKRYYKLIDDFEARFPYGAPSLLECQSLEVKGDILFGKNVSVKGDVKLTNDGNSQIKIPDNTVVNKDMNWN